VILQVEGSSRDVTAHIESASPVLEYVPRGVKG
jgi:hypothetical protein